jgi:hypothetical protein
VPDDDIKFIKGLCLIGAALFLCRLLFGLGVLLHREMLLQ